MNVDNESKRSVISTVTMAGASDQRKAPVISSRRKAEEKSGGLTHRAGASTHPPLHAAAVTTKMPAR